MIEFSKAIEFDPANNLAYYNRGLVYDRVGDKIAAQRDFVRAKQLGFSF